MKSAFLVGKRKIEVKDVPDPLIQNGNDVLIQIKAVGICGSDVHYYVHGRIGTQVVSYPYRVGHECAGVVLETGAGVNELKKGDIVAIDPAISCGHCDQCRSNRPNTCRYLRFLGTPGQGEGCLCERLVMPAQCCYKVHGGTAFELAAFVEPLSIGIYSVKLYGGVSGKRGAILGCGPIGLSVLISARAYGIERIYATDKIQSRLKHASHLGADWVGNPLNSDIKMEIEKQEPLLLDVVWECCGQQEALDQAVDLLKPGGTLVIVGIPEIDRVSFVIDSLRRKEIRILNVRRQHSCVAEAVELMQKYSEQIASIITHRFSLEDVQEAFEIVAGYRDGVVKAMILP
jgi:L-iditol 2-dehydrogenase